MSTAKSVTTLLWLVVVMASGQEALAGGQVGQWTMPGGDWSGSYYSPLAAIDEKNVARLGLAWQYSLGTDRGLEATPIVVDGTMYTSGNWGQVYALNAATGALLWTFDPMPDDRAWGRYACCDVVNRGVVVAHGLVYVGSEDGYLVAIDARTGKLRWRTDTLPARGRAAVPYTITGAPLVAGDRVIIGNGGSDFRGARGFVSAFDARTGGLLWRFYVVPRDPRLGAQEQGHLSGAVGTWPKDYHWGDGAGATVWDALAYDPTLHLVYFGTANPAPYRVELKKHGGYQELYSDCIIAVHVGTGKLAWYYQTTPGDGWDYDATAKLILANLTIGGGRRQVLLQANKNGFYYVLDRRTGAFIAARPFVPVNWTKGLDPRTHQPIPQPRANWQRAPTVMIPGPAGAHSWQPMSYDPQTGLVYIPAIDAAWVYVDTANRPAGLIEGNFDLAFFPTEYYDPKGVVSELGELPALSALEKGLSIRPAAPGSLVALDAGTGKVVWEKPGVSMADGGVLSTKGNLVIRGDIDGMLTVYAADTGKLLKRIDVGTSIMAAPMTYLIGGIQYISVMAGFGGGWMDMPISPQSAIYRYGNAGRILTFRLDGGVVPKPALLPEQPFPTPPHRQGTHTEIARGDILYNRYCSRCHVFGRGELPDLRRVASLTPQGFDAIVLEGALESKGMARWNDVLSPADATAIHDYLIDQAWQEYAAQSAATHK